MTHNGVAIRLPSPGKAPGFRAALSEMAQMDVVELAEGWVSIAPRPAGRDYFSLTHLCDASSEVNDETWKPLVDNRSLRDEDIEISIAHLPGEQDWRKRVADWAETIYDQDRPEAGLAYLNAKLSACELQELPAFLNAHVPALFTAYPSGSLWFMRTDPLVSKRFTLLRALLTITLTPDVLDLNDPSTHSLPQLRTLQQHSLTRGSSFGSLIDPMLLTFSPGALGYVFDWAPHALVFMSGVNGSLVRTYPSTPCALYEPDLQAAGGFHWKDSDFYEDVGADQAQALLQWWTARLNVVYRHLLDPTNFHNDGRHSAALQTAWILTFERMLADLLLIQTGVQRSELARQQAAFDLLDKAESLLGGSKGNAGQFDRLLRRASMQTRLDEVWQRLPIQLQSRFRAHTRTLYREIYEGVARHAYEHRVVGQAIKVGPPGGPLAGLSLEGYVPQLIRAVRNSSHGLIDLLTSEKMKRDRELLASHDGKLPPQVPDLAALIGFALVADFERVADKTWLPDL